MDEKPCFDFWAPDSGEDSCINCGWSKGDHVKMADTKSNGSGEVSVESLGVPTMLEVIIEGLKEVAEQNERIIEQNDEIIEKLANLDTPGNGFEID